jgi:hypothetical protein
MLRFDLDFDTALVNGYTFHIGDSLTNRGKSGDDGISNTSPYIGEAFSLDKTWTVHTNDLSGHETAAADNQEPYVVVRKQNYISNEVTLFIGDEFISTTNDPSAAPLEFQNEFIPAALREQGQDYDIAVGMNRLIDGVDGVGLCNIAIIACDAL